jgi:hypothetical protein
MHMWNDRGLGALAVALAVTALASGCGSSDDLPRQAVSGSVSLGGKPLESGMIQFQPTSANETTAAGTAITSGRYAIPENEGLVPGKYQVMITGVLAPPAEVKVGLPGEGRPTLPAKELIPTKYNSKTELAAQVTPGGPNRFDYDLKTQ